MSTKRVLSESVWKEQVFKEKVAAQESEHKYGFMKEEMIKVHEEVAALVKDEKSTSEFTVTMLPENSVPVPKQASQMIGWRSTQPKYNYERIIESPFRRKKPLEDCMCICRAGYECVCEDKPD
jgi:hypothetical protein